MTEIAPICDTLTHWLSEPNPQNPNWSPEDWETFQFVCRVHGIAPFLHEVLGGNRWLQDDIRIWLSEQYQFNAQRIAKMHAELKATLALFSANDVPVMPLKGSILSVELYDDPAWRPMADLDLLIRPADFDVAVRLLTDLGYEQDVVHWKHTEFSKPDNRQVVSTTCEHPDNPRTLELHLHCRETFGGPTLELTHLMWESSVEGELLGERMFRPSLAMLWLHLLVHSTYHLWQGKGRLIHLLDLARLTPHLANQTVSSGVPIHRPHHSQARPADHDLVEPMALKLLNTVDARYTYPTLAMLKKYFPAAVEPSLVAAQQARVSTGFQRWAHSLDLVNTSFLNPRPAGLSLTKALHFSEGRPQEVLQSLRFAFLPDLQEIALDHPRLAQSKMPWLAYFLLPLDWIKRLR